MNIDAHIYVTRTGALGARLEWTAPDGTQARFIVTPASTLFDFTWRLRSVLVRILPSAIVRRPIERVPGSWE